MGNTDKGDWKGHVLEKSELIIVLLVANISVCERGEKYQERWI